MIFRSLRQALLFVVVLLVSSRYDSNAQVQLLSFTNSTGTPGSVRLGWNPSPSPTVTGYLLCWGLLSGNATNRLDVGNVTNAAVGGLEGGITYYFTAVAYDDLGEETAPSNEVDYTPPVTAPILEPPSLNTVVGGGTGAVVCLRFQGRAGQTYEVEATTDLVHWVTILTTNSLAGGMIVMNAPDVSRYPRRFFRLRLPPVESVPSAAKLSFALRNSGTNRPVMRLSFQGRAGHTYEIQATTNLVQWDRLWATNCTTDGLVAFDVADLVTYQRRFFRLAFR